MLRTLHVRNLAVVEEAVLELGPGFATLTGETGAGKSLVVDSLALLGGARAHTDAIRTGAGELRVTGVFELAGARGKRCRELLEAAGVGCDDATLVVRREVARKRLRTGDPRPHAWGPTPEAGRLAQCCGPTWGLPLTLTRPRAKHPQPPRNRVPWPPATAGGSSEVL